MPALATSPYTYSEEELDRTVSAKCFRENRLLWGGEKTTFGFFTQKGVKIILPEHVQVLNIFQEVISRTSSSLWLFGPRTDPFRLTPPAPHSYPHTSHCTARITSGVI